MAAQNNSIKTPKLLLERWAEIEARDARNGMPLHLTGQNNDTETAKLLLERDAEIEARDENNKIPLHCAA